MYLKSIEMQGFKSFADRTKLEFDSGITAIVGPNGCGKSNIVDAFRWCLGEQSANSLRSKQMLDVIFNGSQTRASSGYAEVILNFDNTENILPVNYSEVTVSRKIFRSGESEYYLNRVQCRLKDIRDLFLDTGIGAEGYSIFEQGKVEFITKAKPEERRGLFEEAAGVSKYKVRREETLRKLDRVHQDMERVNDMLLIIKEQITSLESAVRKAKLYQKYQDELREYEIADIVKKIINLNKELEPLKNELENQNKNLVEISSKYDIYDADLSKLRVDISVFDNKLNELQTKLNLVTTEIVRNEDKRDSSQNNIKEYKERQIKLKSEIEKYGSDKKNIIVNISVLKQQIIDLEKNVNELQNIVKEKEDILNKFKTEISNIEQKISEINSQRFELIAKKTQLNNQVNKLNSLLIKFESDRMVRNRELVKLEEEKSKLEQEKNVLNEEINKLKTTLEKHIDEYNSINNNLNELKQNIEITRTHINKLKENHITLTSRIKALDEIKLDNPKYRAIKSILDYNIPGIHGTVSSILKFQQSHRELVCKALGEKLDYLICDTLTHVTEAINFLKENKLGQCTFVVLEYISNSSNKEPIVELKGEKPIKSYISYDTKWEPLINFLLGDIYVSGDTIYAPGIVTGGSEIVSDNQKVIFEQDESIKLETEIEQIKDELTKYESQLEQQESLLIKTEEERYKLNNIIQEYEFKLKLYKQQLDEKNQLYECNLKNDELIKDEIKQITDEEEKTHKELANLIDEIDKIDKQEINLLNELNTLKESLPALKEKELDADKEYNEHKTNFSVYQERLQNYVNTLEKFNKECSNIENRVVEYNNEITILDKKIKEQTDIFENSNKRIDELYNEKLQIETQIDEINKERVPIFQKIEEKQKQLNELKNNLNILQKELHEKEIVYRTKELEKNNFEKKLQEYNIDFNGAVEKYSKLEFEPDVISKLKRRLESMGTINFAAQEEYTNLEQRHNWVLSQQQDLLKAEQDLRATIQKINSHIQGNFKETFYKVRENFKTIFKQLFEGGEADLILTDENNILETGIEIIAQPPGKKLQNIGLLSGGENALISIALLFAFFLVKPSPVCILDEVDAPLDESNIVRFINMIKSYSDKLQFIVITHNKRTMEIAKVIYGITMEEFGVSKVLSMQMVNNLIEKPAETQETVPA